ncbi:uncharacterized protein LOC9326971 isoform X1 [Arabidopsis lyrata subsp. lyrata]|uniref:uncharacterized protein LOC9326971 isoform X1 n=1 Tax=Arabidopsis lyrata subsp. lyrata TaxID=81972 RepID=UPI000A29CCE0|nr:uncharacterized protein LOC9326971 isoform X1 [Arabidopsis lyrata subsp. lyrata]|eukprot:XP_020869489.1 uncharacterized protein LOC9326971 isoform X1 [Arabidopsis lyrata subsp. lyrata]
MADAQLKKRGYIWAISAGLNAALAAISAKFFSSLVIKYGLVVICNVVMWACYVNSLRALSSLQATVTNFAANFLSSGLAGLFLFQESLSFRWFAGALSITIGVLILSKSSVDKKILPRVRSFADEAFRVNVSSVRIRSTSHDGDDIGRPRTQVEVFRVKLFGWILHL